MFSDEYIEDIKNELLEDIFIINDNKFTNEFYLNKFSILSKSQNNLIY